MLQTEIIPADAAMHRCKWKCIGEDNQQVGAPRLVQKYFRNRHSVSLQNEGDKDRGCDRKKEAGIEKLAGLLLLSMGHAGSDTAGESKLNADASERKAQCVDWKYKLIEADSFLTEGMA